jgi:gliding motility-associated-like protein
MDSVTVNTIPTTGPLTANAGSNETVCQGEPFTLNGTTSGGYGNNSYTWADVAGPGADSAVFSTAISTSLISGSTGVYTYQLEITDQCGYIAFDTVMIDVSLDCSLTIPNIFTPNGDGVNDNFKIVGNGLKSYSIMIYNRWGEKVFESTDILSPWTGGGKQDGTYYYILKAETSNGKLFEKQGYVQLLSN